MRERRARRGRGLRRGDGCRVKGREAPALPFLCRNSPAASGPRRTKSTLTPRGRQGSPPHQPRFHRATWEAWESPDSRICHRAARALPEHGSSDLRAAPAQPPNGASRLGPQEPAGSAAPGSEPRPPAGAPPLPGSGRRGFPGAAGWAWGRERAATAGTPPVSRPPPPSRTETRPRPAAITVPWRPARWVLERRAGARAPSARGCHLAARGFLSNRKPLLHWPMGQSLGDSNLWSGFCRPGARRRNYTCAARRVSAADVPSAEGTALPTAWAPCTGRGNGWRLSAPPRRPSWRLRRRCRAGQSGSARLALPGPCEAPARPPARVLLPAALGDRARPQGAARCRRAAGVRAGGAGRGAGPGRRARPGGGWGRGSRVPRGRAGTAPTRTRGRGPGGVGCPPPARALTVALPCRVLARYCGSSVGFG